MENLNPLTTTKPQTDFCNHFRRLVDRTIPQGPSILAQGMRHILTAPSQLIRPQLVYATNQIFSGHIAHADACALAIEYIHSFSLIHDDLPDMDDAKMRRQLPTAHTIWGNGQAILIGDALLCAAITKLTQSPCKPIIQTAMIKTLMQASGHRGMTEGQSLDIKPPQTIHEWQRCYEKKTGALIAAAMMLGALSAERTDFSTLLKLKRIGLLVGFCYQIQDDLLDCNVIPTGKDKHIDQQNMVQMIGIPTAKKLLQQHQQTCLDYLKQFPNHEPLTNLIHKIFKRPC